ncbi:myb family transcription factor EFM [Amborella trichopoda]|uniref:HTH myb-type domain-containing protein n=1 Tax=Amborella trichopoda TaxID=13333 RepID=W1NMG1_AMBTC|nr:myb family transcription factor EFM [Amborella trichopoda]ERM97082.1 hypothetical protein AMTR_s00122p00127250 [Amborella trichopoda]|eukprot:XP_006829666.1 myb family transcription factor EFM [Amborella trichopoda]
MEASRQQLASCSELTRSSSKPVLEEFIPIKRSSSEGSETTNMTSDKANWMTSAQLWSDQSFPSSQKPAFNGKQRNGGAFLPFSKDRESRKTLSDLALASTEKEEIESPKFTEHEASGANKMKENYNQVQGGGGGGLEREENKGSSGGQTQRKARRCWSPDLHRRFVSALQQLGGSQVATPKQIRELMKVDGLTNDEVKSHLQKYRLHTRRPSPTPQAVPTPAPQLVVLGGIWVPQPDFSNPSPNVNPSNPSQTLYTTTPPTQPHHFCQPTMAQDHLYAPTHRTYCDQMALAHMNPSHPNGSVIEQRGGSESIEEDGKSESGSAENEVRDAGPALSLSRMHGHRHGNRGHDGDDMDEDGDGDDDDGDDGDEDDSTGSEITLKF